MRKLILAMFVSLDGFIEGPNGEFVPPDWSGDLERHWADANVDLAGTLVYGRKAFEGNVGYWPGAEHDMASPESARAFAARMNRLPKVVLSHGAGDLGWNSRTLGPDLAGEIGRLRAEEGQALVCFGGAEAAWSLMGAGLVDEYRLMVLPLLLGEGKPLFNSGYDRAALELVESRALDTGAVVLHYRRKA